jgi:hypothetical protein
VQRPFLGYVKSEKMMDAEERAVDISGHMGSRCGVAEVPVKVNQCCVTFLHEVVHPVPAQQVVDSIRALSGQTVYQVQ